MNFNQLIYLKELVYYGSFTQAAQHLGISQPALSIQIKKLEEETDLVLVDRDTKPLKLTADGEAYFEMVSEILQRMEALKDFPFQLANEIKGVLKLGIIPTLAPYFISLFLNELTRTYPALVLSIEESITEDIIQKIRSGDLDAGVISTPVTAGKMDFSPMFYEKFFLYVSEAHPLYEKDVISLEELDFDEIWYLKEGNCFRNQVNAICSLEGMRTGKQNIRYVSNSIESLRRIVERKQGITFIPELATMQIPSEQEEMIKRIAGREPVREISLVHKPLFTKKRLLNAFTEVALSQLPLHMKTRPSRWIVDTGLNMDSTY